MGRLPESAVEARLAATLFLLVLGVADVFGALQVSQFAAFTPRGVAASVGAVPRSTGPGDGSGHGAGDGMEMPVDPATLNEPVHRIDRELLVQDTHIHVPAYAMTAAFLAAIVLGLRLRSRSRVFLVTAAFGAPVLDFAGLWGAQLSGRSATAWAGMALAGGFAMGAVYLVILFLTIRQCWFGRKDSLHA